MVTAVMVSSWVGLVGECILLNLVVAVSVGAPGELLSGGALPKRQAKSHMHGDA